MGAKKKVGKNRLDKYYHLAKEQGYRARSAYKLVQLNRKYNFLEKARVLVDLCAAPGGWLQVAAKHMPLSRVIIGIDLAPIKPIPNVITMKNDITTEKCRAELRRELKTWKADVFLNDGAPNVGSSWTHDAFTQAELVLHALKLACEFLVKGGTFVTKVFRSKDYNSLLWVFQQLFVKVEATKPASSRNESAEIFVVCREYKCPDKLDNKFFDPKYVFSEVESGKTKVNIFKPAKRQREGYEDGATIIYKKRNIMEFLEAEDPTIILAESSELTFEGRGVEIKENKFTDEEILELCKDVKILGKRELMALLKWRRKMRKVLEMEEEKKIEEKEQVEEVDSMDELDKLVNEERQKDKKKKKKELMKKAKSALKMANGNPIDHFEEQEDLFNLKKVSSIEKIENATEIEEIDLDEEVPEKEKIDLEEEDSDSEGERLNDLEQELEEDYERYKQRLIERDPKALIKMKRATEDSDEFFGFSDKEEEENRIEENELIIKEKEDKVKRWFDQPIFSEFNKTVEQIQVDKIIKKRKVKEESENENESEEEIEQEMSEDEMSEVDKDEQKKKVLMNPQGLTLALNLAKKKVKKSDLVDNSFNRYSFNDSEGLPSWFIEDEQRHNKPQMPVTKEAVELMKQKLKAIDNRSAKKHQEAKARQKRKAFRKLEAMKKKADSVLENEEMSEKQKLEKIQSMMKSAVKSVRPKKQLVVAKGGKKGVAGRPNGVKGKYKMVDRRLKKEVRAQKRIAKKKK
ncbi:FtsJ-domain-containing protein [Rozella allomycis CSF55]|uniref:FtsJ-domain-containing protein n=1 Tax=Rozella allomycis (strain CSF55) TaxID=988480 RepID=A0A4P9YD42_ROZAC|nr:FtsJ-domain-containing protein [Rozella allomycis CSF55]